MSNFNFDVRNEFSTSKLVKIDFLNTEKAQQIKVGPHFVKAAILDCILQPYDWVPRWLPGYKMWFRVPSTRNNNKN